jgi:hypothetical protein
MFVYSVKSVTRLQRLSECSRRVSGNVKALSVDVGCWQIRSA